MEPTQRITDVWQEVNKISNWDQTDFDWNKAYVASVFAKIAYLHTPAYELKNTNRVNLIPCKEYREIIKSSKPVSIEQILTSSDFGKFTIIEKPNVVAVIVKVKEALFISLRGTQQLYDWLVNLNFFKSLPYPMDNNIKFHKGFHRAIASCMYEIHSAILQKFNDYKYIYVTGHSLGGALAAILHSLWNHNQRYYYFDSRNQKNKAITTHSCYTFGMPRYGNFNAMQLFSNPFHIYNQSDIVPTVPPKLFGFDDSLIEYCLTAEGNVDSSNLKGCSLSKFIFRLATLKGLREHDIEIYMDRIKKNVSP